MEHISSNVVPSSDEHDASTRLTKTGHVFGMSSHMAPEQFVDAAACDERSDIYSFGIVLYETEYTGRLPYRDALEAVPTHSDNSPLTPMIWLREGSLLFFKTLA